jgi:hypothetical protein
MAPQDAVDPGLILNGHRAAKPSQRARGEDYPSTVSKKPSDAPPNEAAKSAASEGSGMYFQLL